MSDYCYQDNSKAVSVKVSLIIFYFNRSLGVQRDHVALGFPADKHAPSRRCSENDAKPAASGAAAARNTVGCIFMTRV